MLTLAQAYQQFVGEFEDRTGKVLEMRNVHADSKVLGWEPTVPYLVDGDYVTVHFKDMLFEDDLSKVVGDGIEIYAQFRLNTHVEYEDGHEKIFQAEVGSVHAQFSVFTALDPAYPMLRDYKAKKVFYDAEGDKIVKV